MKLILIYIFFIGAPILGVTGLLHLGEKLTPPASVKGRWIAELERPAEAKATGFEPLVMTISQSGTQLFVVIQGQNQLILSGQIEDLMVRATAPQVRTAIPNEKDNSRIIQLDARLDRMKEPDCLSGELTLSANPLPIQVPFVAIRQ